MKDDKDLRLILSDQALDTMVDQSAEPVKHSEEEFEGDPKILTYDEVKERAKRYRHAEEGGDSDEDSLAPEGSPTAEAEQLVMGIEVEKEHADTVQFIRDYYEENGSFPDNDVIFEHIAKDHLKEMSDYYTKLKAMEAK